jgi:peptide-methionine (S)-S-oxide reductase
MFCELRGASLSVSPERVPDPIRDLPAEGDKAVAVLAGGCFWCVEAVFKELDGVLAVTSGYTGGTADSADYRSVCSGTTDHAEAVEIHYDPRRVSYGQLLRVFFAIAHDPTQMNQQGADRGRQYRSAIFYRDPEQKAVAEAYIRQLDEAGVFRGPIVTRMEPLNGFFEAEGYHQDYARRNPGQPYIEAVAMPKVGKLREYFGERLKGSVEQIGDCA